jgi:hypothetical protein
MYEYTFTAENSPSNKTSHAFISVITNFGLSIRVTIPPYSKVTLCAEPNYLQQLQKTMNAKFQN